MNAACPTYTTYEDYLLGEQSSDVKHEWCAGAVYAMSRGTPEHGRLVMNIGTSLNVALRGKCTGFASETMLYVEAALLSTYADASFVCGEVGKKSVTRSGVSLGVAVINPSVIVEVLSDSTERYDRDGKFQAYKLLPSFEEYVLVSQHEPTIEVYRRAADGTWSCETAGAGGSVTIHGARISVDEVYA